MTKEVDLTIVFCPECRRERSVVSQFCSDCGTKLIKVELIVCMEEGKVTRLLLKK